MRERKKRWKYFVCFVIGLLGCMIFPGITFAKTSERASAITPKMLKEWDNGAKVTKKAKGSGNNYNLSVTADTNGLADGYYSVYYYDYGDRSISGCDGIRFHYYNTNAFTLNINATLTLNAKTSVSLVDNSYVILLSDDKTVNEAVQTQYGTIAIPAGFSGTVYAPFSQFHTSDGKNVALKSIKSWGITTVMSQNQKAKYEIGNIAFLSNSVAARKASYNIYTITGDSIMNIPNTGSSTEHYNVSTADMEGNALSDATAFFLPQAIAGASITPDGILEIQSDCVASEIIISAKTSNSVNAGNFKITLNHLTAEVSKQGVPRPADATPIIGEHSKIAIKLMPYVKILLLAGIVLTGILLIWWFYLAKKHYKEIEKKLLKKFVEQNKEEKS